MTAPEQAQRLRGFGLPMRTLLAIATAVLALSPTVRYFMALCVPTRANEIGLQWITSFPRDTIQIATVAVTLEAVLKIMIVWEIWKIIGYFRRGEFTSRKLSAAMRRVSTMLIAISITGTLGLLVGLGSLWFLDRPFPPLAFIGGMLNIPSGAFVCAILGFATAAVFDRASRMARDTQFLV